MLLYNYKQPCIAFYYFPYILKDERIWMAILLALPTVLATSFLKGYETTEDRPWFRKQVADEEGVLYASLSLFVSYVVFFRIDMSYARFKLGCKNAFIMTGDMFDSASLLMSFTRASKADRSLIDDFQHTIIRLFSLLNALILADLEANVDDMETALEYEVIDVDGFDEDAIDFLRANTHRVPVVFQWLQDVMVDNCHNGVLSVPPPIATRAFQELGRGMVKYHEATDIARVPFPFPLASTTEVLLIAQCCVTPIVMVKWTDYVSLAVIFSFLLVFTLWFFVGVSTCLENPFDGGKHSLDTKTMQREHNSRLLTLLLPATQKLPELSDLAISDFPGLLTAEMQPLRNHFEVAGISLTGVGRSLSRSASRSANFKKMSF